MIVNSSFDKKNSHEEIDLSVLFFWIYKRKRLVLLLAIFSFLLGCIKGLTTPPTWEGHSQIVIRTKGNLKNSGLPSSLGGSGLSEIFSNSSLMSGSNSLKTEVKILESPSLLKPIYDYVKIEKQKLGYDISRWNFFKWKKNYLEIELEKSTSVLNLKYRDNDKALILPVLKKISKAYQKYSGLERERGISQGITFLEEQIDKTRLEAKESLSDLQEFSLDNGLGTRDGLPLVSTDQIFSNKLNSVNNNSSLSSGIFSGPLNDEISSPQRKSGVNRYSYQYQILAKLESELVEKSAVMTDESSLIITLKNRINKLKESLSRPKEILVKHRELKIKAARDEQKLFQLENQLAYFQLEKAKQSNPWELITKPTLFDDQIAPVKSKIAAVFLIAGLFISLILVIILEFLNNKPYLISEFKKIIPYELIFSLSIKNKKNWKQKISILTNEFLDISNNQKLALIFLDHNECYKELIDIFNEVLGKNNILTFTNALDSNKCNKRILITMPGKITNNEIKSIIEDLKMQKTSLNGWIFLDPYK